MPLLRYIIQKSTKSKSEEKIELTKDSKFPRVKWQRSVQCLMPCRVSSGDAAMAQSLSPAAPSPSLLSSHSGIVMTDTALIGH